jgi:peptidoglycan LD-endopeptidase LytH
MRTKYIIPFLFFNCCVFLSCLISKKELYFFLLLHLLYFHGMNNSVSAILQKHQQNFHAVLPFNADTDSLLQLDFSAANTALTPALIASTKALDNYIQNKLTGFTYGIGGYGENRVLYQRRSHFNETEPRSIHLGIDVWAPVGTPIFAALGGMVHSVAFNNNFGDYGATIILQHQLDTIVFHTLYGHVSQADIAVLSEGMYINRGQQFAHIGSPAENGDWPPHLHLQLVADMELKEGDYPGVCSEADKERFLANCPNPDLILQLMQYAR